MNSPSFMRALWRTSRAWMRRWRLCSTSRRRSQPSSASSPAASGRLIVCNLRLAQRGDGASGLRRGHGRKTPPSRTRTKTRRRQRWQPRRTNMPDCIDWCFDFDRFEPSALVGSRFAFFFGWDWASLVGC